VEGAALGSESSGITPVPGGTGVIPLDSDPKNGVRRLAGAAALIALACGGPSTVEVATVVSGPEHSVEVSGLSRALTRRLSGLPPNDSAWSRALAVYVEQPGAPPIIGRYALAGGRLRFTPRFPFTPGVSYRVEVDTSARVAPTGTPLIHRFALPATVHARTTRVVGIHPSAPTLPANLLRWYIEFSASMEAGNALAYVHLMDESGREVTSAFLALDQELWDPERRRLTLLFDPGRVKRGVRTNVESGAPLVTGRRYRLVIDDSWPDGKGARLASGADVAFAAGADDRQSPNPDGWRLTPPVAGGRDALRVGFGESLDHALAARMVSVYDALGTRVPGTAQLAASDSVWLFTPERAWAAGEYTLHVDSALEDVAGNSVAHVFDADRGTDTSGSRTVEGESTRRVRFRVAPAGR
jgi:hypothetical protein